MSRRSFGIGLPAAATGGPAAATAATRRSNVVHTAGDGIDEIKMAGDSSCNREAVLCAPFANLPPAGFKHPDARAREGRPPNGRAAEIVIGSVAHSVADPRQSSQPPLDWLDAFAPPLARFLPNRV